MAAFTRGEGYEISHLIGNYNWASLNSQSGTIVNVDGSHGFVCKELATKIYNLDFNVQDLSATIESAPALDATSLSTRIKYMAHDFLNPQPAKKSRCVSFSWIIYNYSKKNTANILCQLKPAFREGARLLIKDYCLAGAGKSPVGLEEKAMEIAEINVFVIMNAYEIEESDWADLFSKVKSFRFLGVRRAVGCRMSLAEAVREGEESKAG